MTDQSTFEYKTFIQATPERVWHALTDPDMSAAYWEHNNISDWQVGSSWEHRRTDGSGVADLVGTVLESTPPSRLALTFDGPNEKPAAGPSRVTFDITPHGEIVRLIVTHENIDPATSAAVAAGWPSVMANLKTLLETGHALATAPWEMHADLRNARRAKNHPTLP